MDKTTHDKGLEIRKAVLGSAHVEKSWQNADDFNRPGAETGHRNCWGEIWGSDDTLDFRTRSMLNIAMLTARVSQHHELAVHVKGALTNGVSKNEIREIFMQVAIYAGVPGRRSTVFRIAREVFAEIDKG